MTGILAKFVRLVCCFPQRKARNGWPHANSMQGLLRRLYQSVPGKARQNLSGILRERDNKVYPITKENIGQNPVAWFMLRVNFSTLQTCRIKLSRIKPAVCPIIYNITGNLEWLIKEWKYFSFLRKKLAFAKIYSDWLGMGALLKSSRFQGYENIPGLTESPKPGGDKHSQGNLDRHRELLTQLLCYAHKSQK